MSDPQAHYRVSLLIETSSAYGRGLLRGIACWMLEHGTWIASLGEYRRGEIVPNELRSGVCDGVIARVESASLGAYLAKLSIPIVNVSRFNLVPEALNVDADDKVISRFAFEHFSNRGFRHYAFVGDDAIPWAKNRRLSFTRDVETVGATCHVFKPRSTRHVHYNLSHTALVRWATKLPKPIGVFCAWDGFARQLLSACREANLHVPDELAVLGVGNDDLEGSFSQPPLSSIMPDAEGAGFAAAELLNERMLKPQRHLQDAVLAPRGLITRQSTDVLALDDRQMIAAIRLVRERACSGLRVIDIEQTVQLSRRQLEARFRKHLGISPHQEIRRVRIHHAKILLSETDLTLEAIADRCGFKHPEYFSVVFKRLVGIPPGKWRIRGNQ